MAQQKTSAALSGSSPLPFGASEWSAITVALEMPPREAVVFELVLRGMCDKQIGVALDISVSTVRTYLRRSYARAGLTNRMELVLHVVALVQKRNAPIGLAFWLSSQ